MGIYWQGTAVVITETFLVDATPTDPTVVTWYVRHPDGTLDTYVDGTDPESANPSVGVYTLGLPGTLAPGSYNYRIAGTGAVVAAGEGDFTILPSPTLQADVDPNLQQPPCVPWVDGEDLAAQCQVEANSTNVDEFNEIARATSELLYELSGRQFGGICQHVVRPCSPGGCGWENILAPIGPPAVSWEWGLWSGAWGWWGDGAPHCGCASTPTVELPFYPVVEIVSVEIAGVTVAAETYELRERRFLVRIHADGEEKLRWPTCQDMSMPLGEPGTWSVTLRAGVSPPTLGVLAARSLGCELYKLLHGVECQIPTGVTQINRQGVSFSRNLFMQWGSKNGLWRTGLPLVDAFLQAYNPRGSVRRSSVWSPDLELYARPVDPPPNA